MEAFPAGAAGADSRANNHDSRANAMEAFPAGAAGAGPRPLASPGRGGAGEHCHGTLAGLS